jgi:fructoselysine-6-P-deglycase FrlB-like protein
MTTELRTSHPYHMHEAILAQPEALVRVVERNESAIDEFATRVSLCERVFLTGIGTSHHASLVGEHLMRAYGGGPDVRALHSFDLALYGPELRREDCVVAVSHRGAKRYTALALEQARQKGCPTALITARDRLLLAVLAERQPDHAGRRRPVGEHFADLFPVVRHRAQSARGARHRVADRNANSFCAVVER